MFAKLLCKSALVVVAGLVSGISAVGAEPATILVATNPYPPDGAIYDQLWARLTWTPGIYAASHDVYFGEGFDEVNDAMRDSDVFRASRTETWFLVGFPDYPHPTGLEPGTTYYWRIDEVNDAHPDSPWKGNVWSFWLPPRKAYNPFPPDGAKFVDPNVDLSWSPGWHAAMHYVRFTDGSHDVNIAVPTPPQAATTYDPGPLEFETTYYWRVDEFDGTNIYNGDWWSFTTTRQGGGLKALYYHWAGGEGALPPDPPSIAFRAGVLTRIDPTIDFQWGSGSPDATVNADDFSAMWIAEVEIAFSEPYTFYTNTDDGVKLWVNGRLIIDNWTHHLLTEDKSEPIELVAGHRYPIMMWWYERSGDAVAQLYWESPSTPKQIIPAGALSPPIPGPSFKARWPHPANTATGVTHTPALRWGWGYKAAQHDVYFGTDEAAVADANTTTPGIYRGRQELTANSYVPAEAPLQWNKTYYWRIDEVNDFWPEGLLWKGDIWSFTTADYLAVDDFEDYKDDLGERIFQMWLDGHGYTEPPPGYAGNGTGSTVGHLTPPFVEQTIVHRGRQSMPFGYNNTGLGGRFCYSETERTWDMPQDWTREGVQVLSLWFYGDPCNSVEQFYIGLEDALGNIGLVTHPDPNVLLKDCWQEWNMNLRAFSNVGVDLKSIWIIYIGLGDRENPHRGGSGTLYIDDIRLYRPRCLPSLARPVADFDGNCTVDYADLVIFASQWLDSRAGLESDIFDDAIVDFHDYAKLAQNWLEEKLWP